MTTAIYLGIAVGAIAAALALGDILSRIPAVNRFADWIFGEDGTPEPDPDRPLSTPRQHLAQVDPDRGLPEVLTLSMTDASIRRRRQIHRNAYCSDVVHANQFLPHPAAADQWWPGTDDSPTEERYHR